MPSVPKPKEPEPQPEPEEEMEREDGTILCFLATVLDIFAILMKKLTWRMTVV